MGRMAFGGQKSWCHLGYYETESMEIITCVKERLPPMSLSNCFLLSMCPTFACESWNLFRMLMEMFTKTWWGKRIMMRRTLVMNDNGNSNNGHDTTAIKKKVATTTGTTTMTMVIQKLCWDTHCCGKSWCQRHLQVSLQTEKCWN